MSDRVSMLMEEFLHIVFTGDQQEGNIISALSDNHFLNIVDDTSLSFGLIILQIRARLWRSCLNISYNISCYDEDDGFIEVDAFGGNSLFLLGIIPY